MAKLYVVNYAHTGADTCGELLLLAKNDNEAVDLCKQQLKDMFDLTDDEIQRDYESFIPMEQEKFTYNGLIYFVSIKATDKDDHSSIVYKAVNAYIMQDFTTFKELLAKMDKIDILDLVTSMVITHDSAVTGDTYREAIIVIKKYLQGDL